MERILRVFPERTSYTPNDDMVKIGIPDMLIPDHDEVHISCTFTWHRKLCLELQKDWQERTDKPVLVGGPAFGNPANDFVPGRYVKDGIIFTSRGCNNNCSFCIVPKVEGKLKELPITPGNIIQDNNFLQCSREHKDEVFKMLLLKNQHRICFKEGLQSNLIDEHFVSHIAAIRLRIKELWLACDNDNALEPLRIAVKKLQDAGFNQNKIYCYALIGDDMEKNEARLQEIYKIGAMPFAQLYQHFEDDKIIYNKDWNKFARQWQRPAIIKDHCKHGTSYKDY